MCDESKNWPEFVGRCANEVSKILTEQGFEPEILPEGSPCTRDYRTERVRLFVDANNKIVKTPSNG